MKNLFKPLLGIIAAAISLSSCSSDKDNFDPYEQLEIEKAAIEAHVKKKYPKAKQFEDSGFWYEIFNEGVEGSFEYEPTNSNGYHILDLQVTADYTGKLLDGTVFDKTQDPDKATPFRFASNLTTGETGGLIPAWILSFLPTKTTVDGKEVKTGFIFEQGAQVGAHFRIITPSIYAYGRSSNGKIPANSPLEFEIKILKMENYKADNSKK